MRKKAERERVIRSRRSPATGPTRACLPPTETKSSSLSSGLGFRSSSRNFRLPPVRFRRGSGEVPEKISVPLGLGITLHLQTPSWTVRIEKEKKQLSASGSMAAIYSLYIINKSGGLIFYKDYGLQGRMDTNDSLRLASL
ncbi:putative trafficking protein particle complex subunit [Helianthus annuus]|nr:putative trafficking protein particle complex subunit [Helianthus annuus]KAJ0507350.1 putative trafficking protein particle complex subunit [Helianthus annuus]KAJ0515853.1 putative trafficking protein particle complex subunit [Helianthus annuus]KAJ0687833.1 putative trafficking protein particle complex subunit [Helianthus annuus]